MKHKLLPYMIFLVSQPDFLAAQSASPKAPAVAASTTNSVERTIKVLAKGSGTPVKRAEVQVGTKIYYTEPSGEAKISIPATGKGKVLIDRFRFEKQFVTYERLRAIQTYEVFLWPSTPGDNEVYVRGEQRPETSKTTISADESARIAPGGDPAQITKLLPGVQSQTFGQDIAVRGSGPNDSIYWIDNFQVPQVFHTIGNISVLPEQMLSDVEFYAGGFGPRYGDATGGVVRLLTKSEQPDKAQSEVRINLPIFSAVYHETPVSDDAWLAASFRYSYLQYLLPYFLDSAGADSVVVPYFGDTHALYVNKDDDGGHTKIFAMGSQDGIKLVIPSEVAAEEDGKASIDIYRGFATLGVERLKPLGGGWSLVAAPQILYDKTDNQFFTDTSLTWDFYTSKVFFELQKRLSRDESVYLGYEPGYGEMFIDVYAPIFSDDPLFDFEEAPRRKLKRKLNFWYQDAWASIDKKIGQLTLTPGLRYRFDGQINKGQVDPRLRWRLKIVEGQVLKGAYGLYSKSPEPVESSADFGNPNLEFIKSTHYVLGLESRWSDRWETDVQLYYKTIYNQVTSDSERAYDNDGSARSKGIEFFVRRNLTDRMFGWLSYTYSVSESRDSDSDAWKPAEFDQTHVATLASSYRLTATWDFGLRYTYRSGDTYTPISDAVYNANLDKYQPREDEDKRNTERLPNYTQIDTWATKDFLFNRWAMALRMGVQYLAFSEQVYAKSYNYDYSEGEDFTSLPPIPYIELRGKF